jgi:hypothetical protein
MSFNSEPELVFVNSPTSRSVFLGICAGYAILFVRSALNQNFPSRYQITFPLIGGLSLYLIVSHLCEGARTWFDLAVKAVTSFLDFPVSFVEAVLTVRLICFISRVCLNVFGSPPPVRTPGVLPKRTTTEFRVVITAISLASATAAFVFLFYGASRYNVSVYLAVAVVALVAALLATLVWDNGIISDSCLVLFRTSLSLAPVLSYSSGEFTWLVRTVCVIVAFTSLLWDLEGAGVKLRAVRVMVRTINRGQQSSNFRPKSTGRALVGLLIAYLFLSPGAFLTPTPKICGWQGIIIPLVYLGFVGNEAGYFHTAVTPAPRGIGVR